jgi:hypothetical protein
VDTSGRRSGNLPIQRERRGRVKAASAASAVSEALTRQVLPHNRGWSDGARVARTATCSGRKTCPLTRAYVVVTPGFETAQDAFEASWDVAPYFTLQPLCNLCLSAPVMMFGVDGARRLHAEAHAKWQKHGRPTPIHEVTGEESERDNK